MRISVQSLPLILALVAASSFAQTAADIAPPDENKAAMTLVGVGTLAYECKAMADKPGSFGWSLVGPTAKLLDSAKKEVGKYYAGPTWESMDGSKVTGKQVAVAPGPAGAIPLQLVLVSNATGSMADVTYIQRLNTVGGVAPTAPVCEAGNAGAKANVNYQADYVFFKKK